MCIFVCISVYSQIYCFATGSSKYDLKREKSTVLVATETLHAFLEAVFFLNDTLNFLDSTVLNYLKLLDSLLYRLVTCVCLVLAISLNFNLFIFKKFEILKKKCYKTFCFSHSCHFVKKKIFKLFRSFRLCVLILDKYIFFLSWLCQT